MGRTNLVLCTLYRVLRTYDLRPIPPLTIMFPPIDNPTAAARDQLQPPRQFSIATLLLVTTLIGVCLGLFRFSPVLGVLSLALIVPASHPDDAAGTTRKVFWRQAVGGRESRGIPRFGDCRIPVPGGDRDRWRSGLYRLRIGRWGGLAGDWGKQRAGDRRGCRPSWYAGVRGDAAGRCVYRMEDVSRHLAAARRLRSSTPPGGDRSHS